MSEQCPKNPRRRVSDSFFQIALDVLVYAPQRGEVLGRRLTVRITHLSDGADRAVAGSALRDGLSPGGGRRAAHLNLRVGGRLCARSRPLAGPRLESVRGSRCWIGISGLDMPKISAYTGAQ